jgi:hypothetical protein
MPLSGKALAFSCNKQMGELYHRSPKSVLIHVRLSRTSKPVVHVLPTDKPTSPVMVILRASLPLHDSPFSHFSSDSSGSIPTAPTFSEVYLGKSLAPFDLSASSIMPDLPAPLRTQQQGGSLEDIVGAALSSYGTQGRMTVADIESKDDILGLLYTSDIDGSTNTTYLIV